MFVLVGSSGYKSSALFVANYKDFLENKHKARFPIYFDPSEKEIAIVFQEVIGDDKYGNGRFLPLYLEVVFTTKDGGIIYIKNNATDSISLPRSQVILVNVKSDYLQIEYLIEESVKRIMKDIFKNHESMNIEYEICDVHLLLDKEQGCHLIGTLVHLNLDQLELVAVIGNKDMIIVEKEVEVPNKKSTNSVPKKSLLKANAHLG